MTSQEFKAKAISLIDDLKAVCASYGLGNDGNEFKIITQVFLYKFLNDKFAHEVKRIEPALAKAKSWEDALRAKSADEYELILMQLGADTARLKPEHFLSTLWGRQNDKNFAETFDATLLDIARLNTDIFSVKTNDGQKIVLFDAVTQYVHSQRDEFAKAIINKLIPFSFERIFAEKFDFYATLFEYLIKDYNKDGGGKYAEYYTPHAVAKIMAACLVPKQVRNVSCYDPASGSGTLLMNLAHAIGEDRCTLYTQDVSQKSSSLLRLNLILNNLVHSIPNVIQGNTIREPYHKDGAKLKKFDFIVSNPPFKLDFSDYRDQLDSKENKQRFFAGIPNVPNKDKDKMAIYLLFIQHVIHSLAPKGRAAVVVPTSFITAQSGIEKSIRQHLVEKKMLGGVVSMPSNIFATTGTNVSILFIDATNEGDVILIDASNLGEKSKDGKNQKTVLRPEEERQIIETFNAKKAVDDFSVVVSYDEIEAKNYSLSAGQYFEVKVEYVDISAEAFSERVADHHSRLNSLFQKSRSFGGRDLHQTGRAQGLNELKKYKLSELYEMSSGISSKPEQAGHGAPFCSFTTVFNNYFLPPELPDQMDTSIKEQETYSLKEGDVLLTRTSETLDELGMSSVATKDYPAATFSGFLKRLRPTQTDVVYHKFLAFYLRSPLFRKAMNNNAVMTLRCSLNEQIFSYLDLLLPDFDQQKKIGDLLFQIYAKIELNNGINAELEGMAKLLYDYWFVQFDFPITAAQAAAMGNPKLAGKPYRASVGKMIYNETLRRELPEGWDVCTVGEVLAKELRTKNVLSSEIADQGLIPVVDQGSAFICGFTDDEESAINDTPKIVFGDHTRILKFINFPFARGADGTQILTSRESRLPQHLFFYQLLAVDLSNYGYARHFKFLKDQKVILPHQDAATAFEQIAESIYAKIKNNIFQNQELTELRGWLLPMLMNGQVTVG